MLAVSPTVTLTHIDNSAQPDSSDGQQHKETKPIFVPGEACSSILHPLHHELSCLEDL